MIQNELILKHDFLREMYEDPTSPGPSSTRPRPSFSTFARASRADKPKDLDAFYILTHAATHRFNHLEAEFEAAGSELETAAREAIAEDFAFIASSYMFVADVEEMISTRNW